MLHALPRMCRTSARKEGYSSSITAGFSLKPLVFTAAMMMAAASQEKPKMNVVQRLDPSLRYAQSGRGHRYRQHLRPGHLVHQRSSQDARECIPRPVRIGTRCEPQAHGRDAGSRLPLTPLDHAHLTERYARSAVHGRAAGARLTVYPGSSRTQNAGTLRGARRRCPSLPGDRVAHGGGS